MALSAFLSTLLPSTSSPCPPPHSLPSHLPLPQTSSSRPRCSSLVTATAPPSTLLATSASAISISGIATAYPALAYSTILYFKSTYNVQITVGDEEPEDKLINRFRREVLKAGVIQECKRRRFFENKHDKKKRKAREAARRNRKRRPLSRAPAQKKHEAPKKKKDDEEDDNWELPDVDIPYC